MILTGLPFAGDITDLTVNSGITVDDSTGEVGGVGFEGIINIDGNLTGTLLNDGTIRDAGTLNDDGIYVDGNLNNLINNGTITGGNSADGVEVEGALNNLTNNGEITGGVDGVTAVLGISSLINNGTITGVSDDGVSSNFGITSLTNNGKIIGNQDGVFSSVITLINNGEIRGGENGVNATFGIGNLINTGKITGISGNGIETGVLSGTMLLNSGIITGGNNAVNLVDIISLTNNGSIIGVNRGISAALIHSLTNAGKITGGNFAIMETNMSDTFLTLLPGSDIFGGIDLGGGINSLVVGNGLSIDHVFATTPDVISTNGAPFVVSGTRVVVVDTTQFAQQDEILFDLSRGIWGTVFNHIGDGRNPGGSVFNSFAGLGGPQLLGGMPQEEQTVSQANGHIWASAFGSYRNQEGDTPAEEAHHELGGFIAGADGRIGNGLRLGGFIGYRKQISIL